ncbi:phage holin family protein [Mycobacterium palustre]|uniref:Transmembrane protein n=1 Tax=Mycobacterium palustre TaxID=153971 RepID=A0A1X1Z0H9_9MYCO|nr:phage holin family protein [Mycobacterium palustre]MCV7099086.1 phage holin family protein [Mycobacterium palustre]ORW16784.1 hypothetical protein AWC19_21715 [Mycobacterium palustre]
MLIIALVLALIGLVALVFAVVTSNELVAWVCIGASVLGVVLLIIDALRERQRRDVRGGDAHDVGDLEGDAQDDAEDAAEDAAEDNADAPVDYPEEVPPESDLHPATYDTTVGESSQGFETSDESAVPADGRSDDHAK